MVKIGFAPTRRSIFSAPDALKYSGLIKSCMNDLGIDFVGIDDIVSDGLLHDDEGRKRIAEKFKKKG